MTLPAARADRAERYAQAALREGALPQYEWQQYRQKQQTPASRGCYFNFGSN